MEENSYAQKLLAEVFGTGFLVFIGVGSVPATLLLNGAGKAHPFTMADLGMISFAFALIVIAMVYALGHTSGCHIHPEVGPSAYTMAMTMRAKANEIIPRSAMVKGWAFPFTMADLGMISFAFALIVIAMVYALGPTSGWM